MTLPSSPPNNASQLDLPSLDYEPDAADNAELQSSHQSNDGNDGNDGNELPSSPWQKYTAVKHVSPSPHKRDDSDALPSSSPWQKYTGVKVTTGNPSLCEEGDEEEGDEDNIVQSSPWQKYTKVKKDPGTASSAAPPQASSIKNTILPKKAEIDSSDCSGKDHEENAEPATEEPRIYPAYTFDLSPVLHKWVPMHIATVLALTRHRSISDEYHFHINHPIKWILITGVVVGRDEFPVKLKEQMVNRRVVFTIDDSSGSTIEATCLDADYIPPANVVGGQAVQNGIKRDKDRSTKLIRQPPPEPKASEEVPLKVSHIDVGAVVKIRGAIGYYDRMPFRSRQVRIKSLDAITTNEEVVCWYKLETFRQQFFTKPWIVSPEDEEECRREAEEYIAEEEEKPAKRRKNYAPDKHGEKDLERDKRNGHESNSRKWQQGGSEEPQTAPEDWKCNMDGCDQINLPRRTSCSQCGSARYAAQQKYGTIRNGDWSCQGCGFHNFATRTKCYSCDADRVKNSVAFAPGDWICGTEGCGHHNFRRKTSCYRCSAARPTATAKVDQKSCGRQERKQRDGATAPRYNSRSDSVTKPATFRHGDWLCDNCGHHNFASKTSCYRCSSSRPAAVSEQSDGGYKRVKIGDAEAQLAARDESQSSPSQSTEQSPALPSKQPLKWQTRAELAEEEEARAKRTQKLQQKLAGKRKRRQGARLGPPDVSNWNVKQAALSRASSKDGLEQ